MSGDL